LLNFGSWSYPDWGGWIFVAAGVVIVATYAFEAFFREKRLKRPEGRAVAVTLAGLLLLSACTTGPEPLRYGQDNCHHCKMGLSDTKFGAEIVTKKGKVYKFDDVNCMQLFVNAGEVKPEDIAQQLVVDFAKTQQLIPVETAYFLYGGDVRSPMNSKVAAFANPADRDKANAMLKAEAMDWNQIKERFTKTTAHHH
jgi:copper chaperone NosL